MPQCTMRPCLAIARIAMSRIGPPVFEAARPNLCKGGCQIDGFVIIGNVIAIVADAAFHLVITASQADDKCARAAADLADDTAHRPCRR